MTILFIFFSLFILLEIITLVVLILGFIKVRQWERQLFQLKLVFPKHMKKLRQGVKAVRSGESVLDLLQWPKLPFMLEVAQFALITATSGGLGGLMKSKR